MKAFLKAYSREIFLFVLLCAFTPSSLAGPDSLGDTNEELKGISRAEKVPVPKPAQATEGSQAPPPYHQVYVLCVGINSNPAYGDLRYAVNDATAVAETFRKQFGFQNQTLLLNEQATKDNILAAIDQIGTQLAADQQDDFIFYFSGHGDTYALASVQDGQTNLTRSGFLVAYDPSPKVPEDADIAEMRRRNVELTTLAEKIVKLPARHRLILLDSCFSGLVYLNQDVVDKPPDELNTDVIRHPTVAVMTAGVASEHALEDVNDEHGIFTSGLLQMLAGDEILTMEELFYPLRTDVRRSLRHLDGNYKMTPQLRYLVYNSGSFLFVPQDQLQYWTADNNPAPDDSGVAKKGRDRPVTVQEVSDSHKVASAPPEERKQTMEHYQDRAAMGDPLAVVALAQLFKLGSDFGADTNLAMDYAAESSDLMTASKTTHSPALASMTDPAVQAVVGSVLKGYDLNKLLARPKLVPPSTLLVKVPPRPARRTPPGQANPRRPLPEDGHPRREEPIADRRPPPPVPGGDTPRQHETAKQPEPAKQPQPGKPTPAKVASNSAKGNSGKTTTAGTPNTGAGSGTNNILNLLGLPTAADNAANKGIPALSANGVTNAGRADESSSTNGSSFSSFRNFTTNISVSKFGDHLSGRFHSLFGGTPTKRLAEMQKHVKTLLAGSFPSVKNIEKAKSELKKADVDMAKLVGTWPVGHAPPEFGGIKDLLEKAENSLAQTNTAEAADYINQAGPLIESLQKEMDSQPNSGG